LTILNNGFFLFLFIAIVFDFRIFVTKSFQEARRHEDVEEGNHPKDASIETGE